MAAITLDEGVYQGRNEFPIAAGAGEFFQNNAVGMDAATGRARPLVAADEFLGFAEAGRSLAAGDTKVRTKSAKLFLLNVPGYVETDGRVNVYASGPATFTKTSAGNSLVGKCHRFDRADWVWVRVDV